MAGQAVVCYHYPCNDGIFAALAAYLSFQQKKVQSRFVPLTVYNHKTVEDLKLSSQDQVFFLDYTGPKGFPIQAAAEAKRVTIVDHHKTSFEMYGTDLSIESVFNTKKPENMDVIMDMQKSGATLALEYFQPQINSQDLKEMFYLVEDADLWKWQILHSKAFHAGLGSYGLEFDAEKNPDIFEQLQQLTIDDVVLKGANRLDYIEKIVSDEVENRSFTINIGGDEYGKFGRCLAVQTENQDLIDSRSQLGHTLTQYSKKYENLRQMSVVAYVVDEDMQNQNLVKLSFRSIGDEDTTVITERFGGGGHKNASSCTIDKELFQSWILK